MKDFARKKNKAHKTQRFKNFNMSWPIGNTVTS